MIRILKQSDMDAVMNIWLTANIQAHSFIPREYWINHFEQVKEILPQSTVYVYEKDGLVQGFIGLTGCHIEGIFVEESMRGKGIGTQLLHQVKQLFSVLTLQVYERNQSALRFYFKEGFQIQKKQMDSETGQIEFTMEWSR
ncbi:MAG: N-acetyltransferase [Acutalibacteraceae bacterium]|nr:N-acetyltransferase [Acutalibacteraceae bacterium]